MLPTFTFTHPGFSRVEQIGWYPEALTFAIVVKFLDGSTVTASLSGVGFQMLYEGAKAAGVPMVELCHFCKMAPANPRSTIGGDTIIICDRCAPGEEF